MNPTPHRILRRGSPSTRLCLALAACAPLTLAAAKAATLNQITNPPGAQGWNNAAVWQSGTPIPGNDYQSVSGFVAQNHTYTVNGVQWIQSSSIRDVDDSNATTRSTSSSFLGDNLLLSTETRLLGKATGGSTQTVNLVLNGGFYHQSPSNPPGPSAANAHSTLAGTITFGTANIAAFGTSAGSFGTFTWNITSAVFGGAGDTLQLTMGGNTGRTDFLNFNGDLTGFAGTLYVGVSTLTATGMGSAFSISSSGLSTTLQLDHTTTNFLYDLGSGNVTFGSLLLGNGTGSLVGPGVYDMDSLNTLADGSFFTGTGTITVVPEPNVTAMGVLAAVALAAVGRNRARGRTI